MPFEFLPRASTVPSETVLRPPAVRRSIVRPVDSDGPPSPTTPTVPGALGGLPPRQSATDGDDAWFSQHPLPPQGLGALTLGLEPSPRPATPDVPDVADPQDPRPLPPSIGRPSAQAFHDQLQRLHAAVDRSPQAHGAAADLQALLEQVDGPQPPSPGRLWPALTAHLGQNPLALEVVLQQFQGEGDAETAWGHLRPFMPQGSACRLQLEAIAMLLGMAACSPPYREILVDALRLYLTQLQALDGDETPAAHAARVRRLLPADGPTFSEVWAGIFPGCAEPEQMTPATSFQRLGRGDSCDLFRIAEASPSEPAYWLLHDSQELTPAYALPGVDGQHLLHLAQGDNNCALLALNTLLSEQAGRLVVLTGDGLTAAMARHGTVPTGHFDLFAATRAARDLVPGAALRHGVIASGANGDYFLENDADAPWLMQKRSAAVSFHHRDERGVGRPHVVALVARENHYRIVDSALPPPCGAVDAEDLWQAIRRYFEDRRTYSGDPLDNTIEVVYCRNPAAPE